jgi:ABC-type hemin transport system ATPase subunit
MDEAPEISLTEHQRYWLKHVRACEAPGKRITVYATDHGLGVRAMYDGKLVLVKKGVLARTRATRFQRTQVVDPVFNGEWRIQLPNGVSVAFAGSVDAGSLITVLRAAADVE